MEEESHMLTKYRLIVFFFLSLLLLLMSACGGEGEKTKTIIPTATATSTATRTSTPMFTTTPTDPVKIGAIAPWSGPMAMSGVGIIDPIIQVVEQQIKDMGGILGGREVKIIRYDDRANVAEAQAGALKLLYDNKVSVLTIGGLSGGERQAVAQFAEENKILFVSFSEFIGQSEMKFSVNATTSIADVSEQQFVLATKVLKAKTVAFLSVEWESMREVVKLCRDPLKAAGIKILSEDYAPVETADFTPYLTKIKYEKPDVLILDLSANESMIAAAKQIMELGGLGDIKVVANAAAEAAVKYPGADGWYVVTLFIPGMEKTFPGAAKFFDDYKAVHGREPSANQIYFYNSFWTAIYAIEIAGTDTDLEKIAQVARSDKLEWDTPIGHARFNLDGQSGLHNSIGCVEGGKLVAITIPE